MKQFEKVDGRILALTARLAGDKLGKVHETAVKFLQNGKKPARALADALEKHKCLPKAEEE